MVAINLLPLRHLLSKRNSILLVCLSLLSACYTTRQSPQWVSWTKDTDHPGIQHRSICYGKNFNGSKFTRWEVEIYNDYTEPLAITLNLSNVETGKQSSERKTLAIPPASLRKVVFYNCTISCQQKPQIVFIEVQMLP